MSDSLVSETTETSDFCPICQIPAKSLKILLPVHVSMCDVKWNELEGILWKFILVLEIFSVIFVLSLKWLILGSAFTN